MSFLTEPLANSLDIEGKHYPINTDFRVWLKFYELTKRESLDFRSVTEGIILCYKDGVLPPSFLKASEAMWHFFMGTNEKNSKSSGIAGKKIFDFTEDAPLIYASFLSEYGIDLLQEDMHWHKFLTLLKNLSPESPFMRVAAIRSINPDDIKDAARRSEIIKKQKIFALPGDFDEDSFADELARLM